MRKKVLSLCLCSMLLSGPASFSQMVNFGDEEAFDYTGFINTVDLLNWINNYEMLMKAGIDSVMRYYEQHPPNDQEDRGLYWLGFRESDGFHAVFGIFTKEAFQVKYQFLVDYDKGVLPGGASADISKANAAARAIRNAEVLVTKLTSGVKIGMKPAVRINPDKTVSVWMFPAPTPDSIAIVGVYGAYQFDSTGSQLLRKDEQFKDIKRYKAGSPASIHLEYPNISEPPLDAMYFAYFYSVLMPEILLSTRTHDIETVVTPNMLSWFVRSKSSGVTWTISRL